MSWSRGRRKKKKTRGIFNTCTQVGQEYQIEFGIGEVKAVSVDV